MARNKFFAALLLLFIVGIGFATPLSDALAKYTEPGENVTQVNVLVPSGNFVLVKIGSAETLLIKASDGSLVEDKAILSKIFEEYVYVQTEYDAKLASIKSRVAHFNSTRNEPISATRTQGKEIACLQYIGVDAQTPCNDYEGCKVACLSSPLCAIAPYFDTGEENATGYMALGFVDSMFLYVDALEDMDYQVGEFNKKIDLASTGGSVIDQEIAHLQALKADAQNMSNNKLFVRGLYGIDAYCPEVNYTYSDIDNSITDLRAIKTGLGALNDVSARADALLAEQNRRKSYIETRGAKWSALREKITSGTNEMSGLVSTTTAKINDTTLTGKCNSLKALGDDMLSNGTAGRYTAAFGKERQFDDALFELNTSTQALLRRHTETVASGNACVGKAKNMSMMMNDSAALSQLADIKERCDGALASISKTVTPAEFEDAKTGIDEANSDLNEVIANAVASGSIKPGGGTPQLPQLPSTEVNATQAGEDAKKAAEEARKMCPIGAVLGLALAFAFVRKS